MVPVGFDWEGAADGLAAGQMCERMQSSHLSCQQFSSPVETNHYTEIFTLSKAETPAYMLKSTRFWEIPQSKSNK